MVMYIDNKAATQQRVTHRETKAQQEAVHPLQWCWYKHESFSISSEQAYLQGHGAASLHLISSSLTEVLAR